MLDAALSKYFGFSAFKPGQREAIESVLAGKDTLVVMPTGAGKSLIYQLAAMQLPGLAIVVSPLVALMKDQADQMAKRKLPATFVNSLLSSDENYRRINDTVSGKYKILLVSPERLRAQSFRQAFANTDVSLFAVDEAHCLSQWGHDFRPDYLHLSTARQELHATTALALTATATPLVQDDMVDRLDIPGAERFVLGFNRPNLAFEVRSISKRTERLDNLKQIIRESVEAAGDPQRAAGVVYAGTRRDAEELSQYINTEVRVRATHYHAGLPASTRSQVQDAFLSGDMPIVVATNAFGMGIDRPDVRWVIHWSMPSSLEAYYQEAGRAGRDGLPARAVMLFSANDIRLQEHFIETSAPSREDFLAVHSALKQSKSLLGFEDVAKQNGLDFTLTRVAVEQLASMGVVQIDTSIPRGGVQAVARPLDNTALNTVVASAQRQQKHRRTLLERMVRYAQTHSCRRRAILDYFGDPGEPDSVVCCDNCLRPKTESRTVTTVAKPLAEMTKAERAALIVLDTVNSLPYGVGKGKLSQMLVGSAAAADGLSGHRNFGKFGTLRLKDVEAIVSQLTSMALLESSGGLRPVLVLSPSGREALREKHAISIIVNIPGITEPKATSYQRTERTVSYEQRQHAKEMGGTVEVTYELQREGMTPEQIAAARGLSPTTIYSHIAELIGEGRVHVEAIVDYDVIQQVRSAIEQVGSLEFASPIKAKVSADIDYGQVRCVIEAVKRERTVAAA